MVRGDSETKRNSYKLSTVKSTPYRLFLTIILLFTGKNHVLAQGSFVNLDFEQARFHVSRTPANVFGGSVDPALAFSGWTIGNSTNGLTYVLYNTGTLGSPAVDLIGPNFPNALGYSPLQGSYSVLVQYSSLPRLGLPTLSQTGLIPTGAQSISFLVGAFYESAAAVTLNGIDIPLVPVSGGRLAGDISAFAGGVAQLTFSTSTSHLGDNYLYFDDVQFSSQPIPEPSGLAMFGVGALSLGFFRRNPSR